MAAVLGFLALVGGVFALAVREQRSYDVWRAAFDESLARSQEARNL